MIKIWKRLGLGDWVRGGSGGVGGGGWKNWVETDRVMLRGAMLRSNFRRINLPSCITTWKVVYEIADVGSNSRNQLYFLKLLSRRTLDENGTVEKRAECRKIVNWAIGNLWKRMCLESFETVPNKRGERKKELKCWAKSNRNWKKRASKLLWTSWKPWRQFVSLTLLSFLWLEKKSGKFSDIRMVSTGKLQKTINIIIIIRELTLEKLLIGGPEVGISAGAPSVKISVSTMAWSQGT